MASGPLGGTTVKGSANFSVVTKGPMTNGATATQANGYFGAFLKLSGFDGIIIKGAKRSANSSGVEAVQSVVSFYSIHVQEKLR